MSTTVYMTVRDFKHQYGIPPEERELTWAVSHARKSTWRGMKLKPRWNESSTEYAYPVGALKKIARALGITLVDMAKDGSEISDKRMMTAQEFRIICPGLSSNFSSNISAYCRNNGIPVEGDKRKRRYPYWVLKRYARQEGKQVLDLPRQAGAELPKTDRQGELPLLNPADGENSVFETQPLLVGFLDTLNEGNSIARENGAKLDARLDKLETKLDKLISSAAVFLAIWKGDKE